MTVTRRNIIRGTTALAGTAAVTMLQPATRAAFAMQDVPQQIEYWHRLTGDSATTIEALAEDFNAAFAGQIEVTPIAQGSIEQLTQKVRAAAAGGGLPAALMADDADVLSYYASDVIVPLEDYISDPEIGLSDEEQGDFLPNQLARHQRPLYDDHTMSFPIGFSTYTFFWNVDALEAAELEGPPATWAELPDAVRAVAAANPGMVFNTQPNLGSVFLFILSTYGVSWLKENGEESNFDAPEALETMQWLQTLGEEGLLVPDENHVDLFAGGQSMFFLQSSVNARRFPEMIDGFSWSAGMPPQGSTDQEPVTEMFGPLNVLPKTDEATQQAGWTWMKWLTDPEPHAEFNFAAGYFPATYAAAEQPLLADYYAENQTFANLFTDVAPNAHIPQPGPGLVGIRGQITSDVVAEVLLGRLPADEAVRRLKAEADEEIQRSL